MEFIVVRAAGGVNTRGTASGRTFQVDEPSASLPGIASLAINGSPFQGCIPEPRRGGGSIARGVRDRESIHSAYPPNDAPALASVISSGPRRVVRAGSCPVFALLVADVAIATRSQ